MIEARDFVEAARAAGFRRYTGVPCSFLTPFINYVINDDGLDYVSAANEGDAVALGAGSSIGGEAAVVMMQNSGLGNAVSPLTSLTWVFRIPVLLIVTHRGEPGLADEPQHELMGQVTTAMLDTMQIPWRSFPSSPEGIGPALEAACTWMRAERRPFALVMKKGTVAAQALSAVPPPAVPAGADPAVYMSRDGTRPSRADVLQRLLAATRGGDSVVIATTGFTGRELYALDDRPNHLYMVGSMGCAPALALGLAKARPDLRVIVVDGDGALLMRMGNLATIGAYGGDNLLHLVLDNEAHDSTGAQATVTASVNFARAGAACGYRRTLFGDDPALLDEFLEPGPGPVLAHLKIGTGTLADLPRPKIRPADVLDRLKNHIGARRD